jgi:hypothetical protein
MKNKYKNSRERFLAVAELRTIKIIKTIRTLKHFNNHYLYKFEPQEIKKIFYSIQKELNTTKLMFKNSVKEKFSFNNNGCTCKKDVVNSNCPIHGLYVINRIPPVTRFVIKK